ncbi:MAG: hypothetical protein IPJ75_01795 [Ignavibacteriales bacterium]|nr:hypothetical protein [Ignavibacteriales bacterium]
MKKSYKKNIAWFLLFASCIAVLLYYYISINLQNTKLSKRIDDLKAEIKIEQSNVNSNKAVFDKLVSKEQIVPLAESKLGLVTSFDSTGTITLSQEEIEEFENKINYLNE